jgi:hypothetical protein
VTQAPESHDYPVVQAPGSHDSPVMQVPGSRDSPAMQAPRSQGVNVYPFEHSPVLAPPGSHFAYFPEFQIIKTALKGTIIQTLLYLLNYLPREMKFLF